MATALCCDLGANLKMQKAPEGAFLDQYCNEFKTTA